MMTFLWAFQQNSQDPMVAVVILLMAIGIGLAISLAIAIVVCILLYGCMNRIPPQFRAMEPGLIWLRMIPLFNLIWNFMVFQRIPESFKRHFDSQGRTDVGDCGKSLGLWYSICAVAGLIPCVNYAAGPAALVLLILFLVKVMGLKGQVPESAV